MLIDVRGVTHAYPVGGGERVVLRDLTVRADEQRIGVIGANGSGKSTFARLLDALVVPTSGQVLVGGLDTATDARAIRRQVGFVFTDPDAQIVMPTVAEDVAFSLRRHRLDRWETARRVEQVLERFGLTDHRDHPAHLLSGGQKQLLAIAAVLVTDPALVVMDEPTTLLDLANTRRIREVIASLDQQVVLVTHELELTEDMDRVLVFDDTRLVYDGDPRPAVEHYREVAR